jgi:hypothetical protein
VQVGTVVTKKSPEGRTSQKQQKLGAETTKGTEIDEARASPEGTRYFFLSRSPILALGLFSTITGTLKQENI